KLPALRPRLGHVSLPCDCLLSARGGELHALLVRPLALEVDQNIRDFHLPCFPLHAHPLHSPMTRNCAVVSMSARIEPTLACFFAVVRSLASTHDLVV